jgi:type IV secretory pathway protease TraF
VSVAMKKNAAVAQVRVSLKDGLTVLELKPGNTATMAELRQIIKNNGFVSKEVTALARGSVSVDQKTFTVSGTNEQLALSSPPQRSGDDFRIVVPAPGKP